MATYSSCKPMFIALRAELVHAAQASSQLAGDCIRGHLVTSRTRQDDRTRGSKLACGPAGDARSLVGAPGAGYLVHSLPFVGAKRY